MTAASHCRASMRCTAARRGQAAAGTPLRSWRRQKIATGGFSALSASGGRFWGSGTVRERFRTKNRSRGKGRDFWGPRIEKITTSSRAAVQRGGPCSRVAQIKVHFEVGRGLGRSSGLRAFRPLLGGEPPSGFTGRLGKTGLVL